MDYFGRVKEIMEPVHGQGEKGLWVRRTIVLESFDNPMNIIALDALNERCDKLATMQPGMAVKASFGVQSRKSEKGYFTTANLWDIQKL